LDRHLERLREVAHDRPLGLRGAGVYCVVEREEEGLDKEYLSVLEERLQRLANLLIPLLVRIIELVRGDTLRAGLESLVTSPHSRDEHLLGPVHLRRVAVVVLTLRRRLRDAAYSVTKGDQRREEQRA